MGSGKGKRYACNFPLREGITDENYKRIFEPVGRALVTRTMSFDVCAMGIIIIGNCASHGILQTFRGGATIWDRFITGRQVRVFQFVNAR